MKSSNFSKYFCVTTNSCYGIFTHNIEHIFLEFPGDLRLLTLKNNENVDFIKAFYFMIDHYDVIIYDINLLVKVEQIIFTKWFW